MKKLSVFMSSLALFLVSICLLNSCSQLLTPVNVKTTINFDLSAARTILPAAKDDANMTLAVTAEGYGTEYCYFTADNELDSFSAAVSFNLPVGEKVKFQAVLTYKNPTSGANTKILKGETTAVIDSNCVPIIVMEPVEKSDDPVPETDKTMVIKSVDGSTSITVGSTLQFYAYEGSTELSGVTWSSAAPEYASVDSDGGLVTGISPFNGVTITATKEGYASANIQVSVVAESGDPEPEVTFTIDGTVYTSYSMSIEPESNPVVTSSVEESYWKSEDESIVTVNKEVTDASQTVTLTPKALGSTKLKCTTYTASTVPVYTYLEITVTGVDSVFVNSDASYTPSGFSEKYLVKTSLEDALKVVNSNGTVYIASDITVTTQVTFSKNVTLSSYGSAVTVTTQKYMMCSDCTLSLAGESETNKLNFKPWYDNGVKNSQSYFVYMTGTSVLNLKEHCTITDYEVESALLKELTSASTINLRGAEITDCTLEGESAGGLIIGSGKINLEYGTIDSNTISITSRSSGVLGCVVYSTGQLTMGQSSPVSGKSLSISSNKSDAKGCAVYAGTSDSAGSIYSNVTISDNITTNTCTGNTAGIIINSGSVVVSGSNVAIKDNYVNTSESNVRGLANSCSFTGASKTGSGTFEITEDVTK